MDNNSGGRFQSVCKYYGTVLKKYLKETTLHALKYVGDLTLNIWARIYFMLSFVTVVVVAINLALYIFNKWQSSPVIIAMSSYTTAIQRVPFPAITICNMNQAKHSRVADFPVDSLDYAMLQKLCFRELNFTAYNHLELRSIDDTFPNFIEQNTQTCEDMILKCKFGSVERSCSTFFREVLTDEGMCCVFNSLHPFYLFHGDYHFLRDFKSSTGRIPVDWNPEDGYSPNLPTSYYPRPARGSGATMGFTIVLNADINDYHCSSTNGAGFKIILYNPIDAPHIRETGLPVMLGHQSRFRINTKSYQTAPGVRAISPVQRQCFFNNEKKLKYFKYYTRRNCEMECDAKFMVRLCNCIPYFMPLIFANASVCHVKDFMCNVEAERNLHDSDNYHCKTQCLPACHDLTYYPDVTVTPFAVKDYGLADEFFRNLSKEYIRDNLALVHFYHHANFFRSYVRTPYTSFTDYLSQTGGIMSLFVGFGVISIAEIFYFSIMQPIFDVIFKRISNSSFRQENKVKDLKREEATKYKAAIRYKNNPLFTKHQGIAKNILKTRGKRHNIGNLSDSRYFNSSLINK